MDNLQISTIKVTPRAAKWAAFQSSLARIFTAVCIICAAVLSLYMIVMRFACLGNGLQYDELYSVITASPDLSFPFIWKNMLMQDINLPLFNILLLGWLRFVPYTYIWMHLFSALFGAAAVVMAWVLAPKYWSALKKYIFVSLMSCSFILVAYGHIVRTYSLSIFLSTIFSLLALRFIYGFSQGKEPSWRMWLVFYAVGLLGAYSHFFCTAEFFISALVIFLYACYYKVGRKWAFWGTAVVFGLWCLWLYHVLTFTSGLQATWWFKTPLAKATFEIVTFLFGPRQLFLAILYGVVLAVVSLISTYRANLLKRADFMLPLMQIVLLLSVVALVSLRSNLWLDRYFLPAMPACILLFTECLDHLRKRHLILLVLWPLLLIGWINFYWRLEHLHWSEYTGWQPAFEYLSKREDIDTILVDMEKTGYPKEALIRMLQFYIPKSKKLTLIPLSRETAPLSWESKPKMYILMPLCSQMHLLETAVATSSEEDSMPLLFHGDTCIYTAHSVNDKYVSPTFWEEKLR